MTLFEELHGLVVSCQAQQGSPLDDPATLALISRAACDGGAQAIRADGPANVRAIKAAVGVPVIALYKRDTAGSSIRITPTFDDARALAEAGCDAIALDATIRPREGPDDTAALIARVRTELRLEVLADIDTLDAGLHAMDAGANAIATTLAGYTAASQNNSVGPDIELVRALASRASVPVFGEGRYTNPHHVAEAITAGAQGVIVGTAITAPSWITAQFVAAARSSSDMIAPCGHLEAGD